MRRAAKKDIGSAQMWSDLRRLGCSVSVLNQKGIGDALVGHHGTNYLLEAKGPRGRLTPAQKDFRDAWRGQYAVVRSLEDARKVIGL
jgi:hypothetical protein